MSRYICVIVLAILATSAANSEDFATRALNTIKDIGNRFRIYHCLEDARAKASSFRFNDRDKRFAVTWISMYSRFCKIDRSVLMQDKSTNNFPFRLNKELRCAFHTGRNKDVRIAFQHVGSIIDEALSIMEPRNSSNYSNNFRGDKDFTYRSQQYFVEEGFFSTSRDINIALGFARGNTLMIVESMTGVYIADYAQDRFQRQQEVLHKTNSVFKITRIVNNTNDIKNEMLRLKANRNQRQPREIVYVRQVTNININNKNNLRAQQRSLSLSYCDPV